MTKILRESIIIVNKENSNHILIQWYVLRLPLKVPSSCWKLIIIRNVVTTFNVCKPSMSPGALSIITFVDVLDTRLTTVKCTGLVAHGIIIL